MNIKDYKLKRPQEGYNSEKERNINQWSGVSDWELFYKNELIGYIYFVGTNLTKWKGWLEKNGKMTNSFPCNTRKEVFEELCLIHHKLREELK
mgnify:CR=1 FL=1